MRAGEHCPEHGNGYDDCSFIHGQRNLPAPSGLFFLQSPESGASMPVEDGPAIVAAGGWCAPTSTLYDAASLETNDYTVVSSLFPVIRVLRPGTPEWDENQRKIAVQRDAEASIQALVHRLIRNVTALQDEALSRVYLDADDAGMDVLLESPPYGHTMWRWNQYAAPPYRFIGLALVERSTETWRRLQGDRPIIIRETASGPYDDDWDDD